jgi:predicted Zn-dependent protease
MRRNLTILGILLVFPLFLSCGKIINATCNLFIPESDEAQMGLNFQKEILADSAEYPQFRNQTVMGFVDSVGRKILSHQNDRADTGILKFTFTVIDKDSVVNAFAIPGGHVFVYTGLIKAVDNEAELAGVLAHEIGHVTQRHGIQSLCQQGMLKFVTDIVLGDSSLIGQIVDGMLMLKFSRDNEFQADSCSLVYLENAGYNPYGMKSFLEKLAANESSWGKIFEPFSTHPNTSDRVKSADRIINNMSGVNAGDSTSNLFPTRITQIKTML